jgi:hypothetical protein
MMPLVVTAAPSALGKTGAARTETVVPFEATVTGAAARSGIDLHLGNPSGGLLTGDKVFVAPFARRSASVLPTQAIVSVLAVEARGPAFWALMGMALGSLSTTIHRRKRERAAI